jgi:hypothetical protein
MAPRIIADRWHWRGSGPLLAATALGSAAWLGGSLGDIDGERVLLAMPDPTSEDVDQDGLVAHQEEVLWSSDANPDTDGDGVDDLVELAQGSDLLTAVSMPAPQLLNVGMASRSDGGVITVLSAIYTSAGQFSGFGYHLGVSFAGALFELPPSVFLPASTLALHAYGAGWIIVLETKVPEAFLKAYGYLGFYSTVSLSGTAVPHAAAVVNLFDFGGSAVQLVPAPPDCFGGSIYKPLPRGEDLPASSWTDDEICHQLTSVVGTDGASVVLDVEDASCISMSSKCNGSSCQAGVGGTIKVLDAGALAGGG